MAIVTLTKDNFNREVLQSSQPVLVDFWAAWCGPCKMLSPVVEEVASQRTDIKVGKVNVDEESELAIQFKVTSIPTLVLFKNGRIARTSVGYISKEEVLALIDG